MAEQNLRTAEGVTKFLRSKTTSINDIVELSHSLLDDELHVYLPNRVIFVFDLLISRFNDQKQPKFKACLPVWGLFNKTWLFLDNEPKARTRSFQTFRFGEAILGALQSLSEESREDGIDKLTQTINLVRLSTSTLSTQDIALNILSTYLTHLAHLDGEDSTRVRDISAFFKASIPVEKYSPKFTSAFVTTALPSILTLLESSIANAQPLVTLIKKTVLSKNMLPNLKENTELLLKQDIGPTSSSHFYKLIVDTLSKDDITTLEESYAMITQKYPEASVQQLKYLSDTKRTLSSSFIQMIFDIEFSKPEQNWNLIQSILQLDIEVGVSQGQNTMLKMDEQKPNTFIDIGQEIIDAHTRARDLIGFFQIWMGLVENEESIWVKQEFCNVVSKSIITLSSSQMKNLIEMVQDSECSAKFLVLSTIVQGLFVVKDNNVKLTAKQSLSSVFHTQKSESDQIWSLRFQLLCLFEDIVTEEHFQELVSQKVKKPCLHQFYTMFRLREIQEFDITRLCEQFSKYIQSSKGSSDVIETVFQRWFVLVNHLFPTTLIDEITSLLLQDKNLTTTLIENNMLFEQTNIIGSILSKISKDIERSKHISDFNIRILKSIPIECYPRRIKFPLLDNLTEQAISTTFSNTSILETMIHILQTPTFKSKVESDIKTIKKIVELEPESPIFKIIWSHYIVNIKEESSLKFAQGVIEYVNKQLSKQNKELSFAFYMANTILSSTPDHTIDLSSLQITLIQSAKSVLNGFLASKNNRVCETSWLLKALYALKLEKQEFELLQPSLKKFGNTIQKSGNASTKAALFLLLSKFSGEQDVEYFASLYIVLRESGVIRDDIVSGLDTAVSSLQDESFLQSSQLLLSSFDGSDKCVYLVEILCTYLHQLKRSDIQASSFIVKSISTILLNFSSITTSSRVIAIKTIKNLLTEKTWAFTQYNLELVLTFLSRCADSLLTNTEEQSVELYIALTHCMSNIVLFHRYRLSNRHHIVLSVFKSLLQALTKRRSHSSLQSSRTAAAAYQRLVTNLCEPPQSTKERVSQDLNSSASLIKRSLRKHLYVLLLSYIHLSLKVGFESEVRELILPGIFAIFDVLSQGELVLVSTSLDYSGRVYYRTVYDEYKKVGKWKTD